MATVLHTITLRDAKTAATARVTNQQTVAVRHNLGAATLEELTAYNLELQGLIDDVTEAQIVAASFTVESALNVANKAAPIAESDVQEGGALIFNLTDVPYTENLRVPAYLQSLFGADGQFIPNTGATAALTLFLLNGNAVTAPFTMANRYGIDVESFNVGKKSFRK